MSFTIANSASFEEEIKKSRFQGIATPVQSEKDVKDFLLQYKNSTTTHQCWAWKIGHDVRFNDDGEPSGTAGRPILATIEGNELTNVLVLVNRWFGGVKLGTGGLVRAYGGCAGQTLLLAEKIELIPTQHAFLCCNFSEWAQLQYELHQYQSEYQEQYTATGVNIYCELKLDQIELLQKFLQNLTRGREHLKIIED
ncbi:YigZ family protein [Acinetobacter qingfengensis]|uniref:Uncharacterized protein n=1 Tax=Acinetobacter qingfengensis TaxID=1262585 RepID=A0A1E7QYP2_9GAMM|nr:YigZ family protein [Acinetobacter qingfengensis]KAA8731400.1 YigZ family protein [Acinetobacter qingfengensis]OEY92195.1 hypothetical protein BJI46_05430 [Acinetobacter qingfengensis]